MQAGERVRMKPDQKVTGVPSARLALGVACRRPPKAARPSSDQPIVNSCVCGFRWSSFLAPATAESLRFQIITPRVMSDS